MRPGSILSTPLVMATMAFAVVAFLFLIDTSINPDGTRQSTNSLINRNTNTIACTQEAKLCPDGSAVGRTGPNCEFAECPDVNVNINTTTNTNTSGPMEGWKKFTNTSYNYSIKYPSDWPIITSNLAAITIGPVPFEPGPGSLNIIVMEGKGTSYISEYKSNFPDGCDADRSTAIGLEVATQVVCREAFAGQNVNSFILIRGETLFLLNFISGTSVNDQVMKQAVSTFTFTN